MTINARTETPLVQRLAPRFTILCGLALTAAWISLLGYGAFMLIQSMI